MITWTTDLSIGHPVIDADHRKLIDIINEFTLHSSDWTKARLMHETLKRLLLYGMEHFEREERIQHDCKFPYCAEHQAEHRLLLAQVEEMARRCFVTRETAIDADSVLSMRRFLAHWLIDHIKAHDMRMVGWCVPPEKAPDSSPPSG